VGENPPERNFLGSKAVSIRRQKQEEQIDIGDGPRRGYCRERSRGMLTKVVIKKSFKVDQGGRTLQSQGANGKGGTTERIK